MPLANASIKSILNNKIFQTDETGYFNIGFPEGEHMFIINEQDTVLIDFYPHEISNHNILIGNEITLGDVNQDMVVDILDVIIMINIILNNYQPTDQEFWAIDINGDAIVNIQDVILIIQIILEN